MAKEKFTQEAVVSALRETRGMVTVAARHLQCSPQTIENYVQRYKVVAEAKRQEREAVLDIGELALVKAVEKGEGWAVCFLLKTQGKDRGYVERTEEHRAVTGDIRIRIEAVDDRGDPRPA